ncbi:C3-binding domain-containing protein [Staphylococcus agnetis]|uniref:C3-binding domain-containing protein n=1 Tax=Staphylococcus agnetis TaxID=985762 RepID=UPI0004E38A0C|nr:C3-binding domain-containing protein [Staphylococcus agnetis]KFE42600.1 immunoglobulin G-binding protein [Staphylococcus agnetis]NJH64463.1 immunoglobulin-binding protein sbi [Staphylococcus agnetis]NJH66149.1 immunoglobulin-binding protein sbi [Staphylococcus agnetis]NJH96748.1 immunoglobulin-binding protein sbi [Staphylococcus agnetis]PTH47439.1 immunoglobulin-binding protein sbi [Staphylococcus agnetis]
MKNKNISRVLMGAATITLATMIANGEAKAEEHTDTSAQYTATTQVDDAQRAYYKVLHLEGLTNEQRSNYIQKLHNNPGSAQEVFSESIKDSNNQERRVGQQNAYYSILKNNKLTEAEKNNYIAQLKQNPDKSQEIWYQSLHHQVQTDNNVESTTPENTPKLNETDHSTTNNNGHLTREQAFARDNELTSNANTSLSELLKNDTIENRRNAQRNVNKAPLDVKQQLQNQLDLIIAQHDAKVRDNSTKTTEDTNNSVEDAQARIDERVRTINEALTTLEKEDTIKNRRHAQREVNKAPHYMQDRLQKQLDLLIAKLDNERLTKTTDKNEVTPKVTEPKQTEKVEKAPQSPSYYQAIKNYITETYNSYKAKYDNAKFYVGKYYEYKGIVDKSVLITLGGGLNSYINPLETKDEYSTLYNTYAKTRNYVTEGINTGKVLYAFYQNPGVVKTAIDTANTVSSITGTISSFFSSLLK